MNDLYFGWSRSGEVIPRVPPITTGYMSSIQPTFSFGVPASSVTWRGMETTLTWILRASFALRLKELPFTSPFQC